MNLNVQKQPGKNSSDISFVGFIKKKKGIYIYKKSNGDGRLYTLFWGMYTTQK